MTAVGSLGSGAAPSLAEWTVGWKGRRPNAVLIGSKRVMMFAYGPWHTAVNGTKIWTRRDSDSRGLCVTYFKLFAAPRLGRRFLEELLL